jgi:hypothetical protein
MEVVFEILSFIEQYFSYPISHQLIDLVTMHHMRQELSLAHIIERMSTVYI